MPFYPGYPKTAAARAIFSRDCNAVFKHHCVAIAQKKLETGHKMCQQNLPTEKLPEYSEFSALFQKLLH